MINNILLMTPPYHTGIIEVTGNWPPLSLVYLAGYLREAGFKPEIYDAMTLYHDIGDVEAYIKEKNPDAVLIGGYTPCINAAIDVLTVAKKVKHEIITVLGGVHASFCYSDILTNHTAVDFIVRGEGEETIVELLQGLQQNIQLEAVPGLVYNQGGNVVVTAERPFIEDLDRLIPAWDLIDWNNYTYKVTDRRLGLMGSSRGCPHKCRFCSQHLFWQGTYRERSPENFVAEAEMLHREYGVRMIMLADEYTTYSQERWEKILDLLIDKGMDLHFSLETRVDDILRDREILWKYRQAGIVHIYVGIESVSQDTLDLYGKELSAGDGKEALRLLDQAGIITECSFILGNLNETADSINETLITAMEFNPDLAHFLLITPWPYTPLYEELKPYIVEKDFSKYHFVHPIVKPLAISTEVLWDQLVNCFRVFYMNKARQCLALPEGFKKDYMLQAVKIMHREFFVDNFGKQAITLPKDMGYELERLIAASKEGKKVDKEKYTTDSPAIEELDKNILSFIEKGVDYADEETFNRLALEEFNIQFNANPTYQEYCLKKGRTPENVTKWDHVPAIPTQAFKEAVVASFPLEEAELALLTSGTSDPRMKGKIYRDKRSLEMIIRSNYLLTKHFIFPDIDKIRILLLVPSPKVAPAMAMAFGLGQLKDNFGTDDSIYLITPEGFNSRAMVEALQKAEETGEPVALVGATSGFVHFFNYCREKELSFKLPSKSRVCDGGGYQGTFGSCSRDEFYEGCEKFFGLSRDYCVNILGMSESGTNYFDNTLREKLLGLPVRDRHKVNLPWTRTVVVGPRTGQPMPKGEIGLIRHYDLTNRATVFAVQTDNLGYETEDGFEIIGRAGGQVPGFGLEPTSVKDWILAGYKEAAAGCSATTAGYIHGQGGAPHMPHSHPCSTVADGMMNPHGHGNQCSTVADGMMNPHGHGNQCSTVADGMMNSHGHGNQCSTVADGMMKPHSHPCSTVADAMIKGQGNPCSTVADGMMKPHSHPCSTVADEMIKQQRRDD